MALTITTNVPIINPAYSKEGMNFVMSSPGADYMELDIYIGDASKGTYEGTKRTERLNGTSLTVDIQSYIQPFFTSDASAIPDLKRVDVVGRTITGNSSTNIYVDNYYVFNGVKRTSGVFDASKYIMNGTTDEVKFLNNWNAPINIHPNDKDLDLYFFQGTFTNSTGSYVANAPSFRISKDGVQSAGYAFSSNTTPIIKHFNICPSTLNTLIPGLNIDANTKYYTIDPSQNTTDSNAKTVNIVAADPRYPAKRVKWVDSMGCINIFNFDKVKTNTIAPSRSTFNNNGTLKSYNIKVSDNYSVTSNWMLESESLYLKDLFTSSSIMVDGEYVIPKNEDTQILERVTNKLINYTFTYQLADDYLVQRN